LFYRETHKQYKRRIKLERILDQLHNEDLVRNFNNFFNSMIIDFSSENQIFEK